MYTTVDENKELREKLQKYEEMLQSLLEGPFSEGTILSKMFNNMYRLSTGEQVSFTGFNIENPELSTLTPGTKVLVSKEGVIISILPEELMEKHEPTKFNFIDWDQIGGLKSQITKIRETLEYPIKYGKLYKEYGMGLSKGVVLYGPAGCGKTLIAKAIASDILRGTEITEDSFIYLKGGEMLSPYVGVAENNIKSIFDRARRYYKNTGKRCVIFIDEAEAILPSRGSRYSSDVDSTIVPTFLSEMDGFEENSTFIILATNFLNQLDAAVVRPGRIDLSLEIGRPSQEDVEDILRIYLSKTKTKDSVDNLARKFAPILVENESSRLSGAFIKNVVEKASMLALKEDVKEMGRFTRASGITLQNLIDALNY